jgi:aerobic-type carbon monoxide dehydrogenase small subunit (CoxS/CutS family)
MANGEMMVLMPRVLVDLWKVFMRATMNTTMATTQSEVTTCSALTVIFSNKGIEVTTTITVGLEGSVIATTDTNVVSTIMKTLL